LAALVASGAAACDRTGESASARTPAVAEAPRTQHVTTREPTTDRQQAVASCTLACLQSVEKADGAKETKRAYCDDDCACFVEARFDETGKAKAFSPQQVTAHVEACRALAIDKVKWSPNLIDGVAVRPVVAAPAIPALDPNKPLESRGEARDACIVGCVESVEGLAGPKQTKRAYCEQTCTCIVEIRFDETGNQKQSTQQEMMAELEACRDKTVKKLKWPAK
jgi:hypothetical protein